MGGQCGHEHLLNTSAIFKVTVHLSRWEAATMPERRLLHAVRSPGRLAYLRDSARSVPSDLERWVNSPAHIIPAGARSSYTSLSFTRSIGSTPSRGVASWPRSSRPLETHPRSGRLCQA